MWTREGNLALQHEASPDGNPYNPDRVQVSDSERRTERDAFANLMIVEPVCLNPAIGVVNGQIGVNPETMLMCSRCIKWKPDADFSPAPRNLIRRGRKYYCKRCLAIDAANRRDMLRRA